MPKAPNRHSPLRTVRRPCTRGAQVSHDSQWSSTLRKFREISRQRATFYLFVFRVRSTVVERTLTWQRVFTDHSGSIAAPCLLSLIAVIFRVIAAGKILAVTAQGFSLVLVRHDLVWGSLRPRFLVRDGLEA